MSKSFPLLALFGHGAMSDLSPLCAPKRTSAKRADQGDARAVSRETKRLPLRQ